ncbi:MAG: hypothetical protein AAB393_00450 [Bacteroidota bacterium]
MKAVLTLFFTLLMVISSHQASAQDGQRSLVSIYNVSAGKHIEFLKWMAEGEAIAKEAGARPTQWYVHQDGAGWDYIAIAPVGTAAEDEAMGKKIDELRKKKGVPTGMVASLRFRQYIGNHSDTFSGGPYTAADLVKMAEGK